MEPGNLRLPYELFVPHDDDVRFGSKADIGGRPINALESGSGFRGVVQRVSGRAIHCSLGLNLCAIRLGRIAVPKPTVTRSMTMNGTRRARVIAFSSTANGLLCLTTR